MDWIKGMQKAINYIEDNLMGKINYDEVAKCAFSSEFHFQRVFSIMCGYTIGEYVRNRRLTLAGNELSTSDIKVIDVALKYGYDSPDSFTKAFTRFHGITPSSARKNGASLKSFSRLSIKLILEGGSIMKYRIEEKESMAFVGYKKKFQGALSERSKQEEEFWLSTREQQEGLKNIRSEQEVWYDINMNITDEGYDHYIAVKSDCEITEAYEKIEIPKLTYAIFETDRSKYPTSVFMDLRKRVISEWLPSSDYVLAEGPEITVNHWFKNPNSQGRYIELWIPVEKNN